MKAYVYIDGFNLYYGAVKETNFKWLDVHRMCELMLPNDSIVGIKYFSAKIFSRPNDPLKHIRQLVYWRALETIPNLEIIRGHYSENIKRMRLSNPPAGGPNFVNVVKTEEKGSDVNLAVHMVNDGHLGKYEVAIIVSNDSDLLSAVEIVQNDLNLPVGILNPHKRPSKDLKNEARFLKSIRPNVIKNSQFPETLSDSKGKFFKPKDWK